MIEFLEDHDYPEVALVNDCSDFTVELTGAPANDPTAEGVELTCENSPYGNAGVIFWVFQSEQDATIFHDTHILEVSSVFDINPKQVEKNGLLITVVYSTSMPVIETPMAMAVAQVGKVVILGNVSGDSDYAPNKYYRLAVELVIEAAQELGPERDQVLHI